MVLPSCLLVQQTRKQLFPGVDSDDEEDGLSVDPVSPFDPLESYGDLTEVDAEIMEYLSVKTGMPAAWTRFQHIPIYFVAELREVRAKVIEQSEINRNLEKELRRLDQKIGLLVNHKMTVAEVINHILLSHTYHTIMTLSTRNLRGPGTGKVKYT